MGFLRVLWHFRFALFSCCEFSYVALDKVTLSAHTRLLTRRNRWPWPFNFTLSFLIFRMYFFSPSRLLFFRRKFIFRHRASEPSAFKCELRKKQVSSRKVLVTIAGRLRSGSTDCIALVPSNTRMPQACSTCASKRVEKESMGGQRACRRYEIRYLYFLQISSHRLPFYP